MRTRAWMITLAAAAAAVVGCGKKNTSGSAVSTVGLAASIEAPPFDDKAMLESIGLSSPVRVSIPVTSSMVEGGSPQDNDPRERCLLAQLVGTGKFGVVPDTQKAPWYSLPNVQNGAETVNLGSRVVTGRSNQTSWTKDSVQFFAETVSYVVQGATDVQAPSSGFGPFSLRLVFSNDPAVGSWKLSDLTVRDSTGALINAESERKLILEQVFSGDSCDATPLLAAVHNARTSAFDVITHPLATRCDG